MKKSLILYKCMTPLHVGEGNNLGVVDMPIQREKHTNFPKMESSGIKGSFLDYFEKMKDKEELVEKMFGKGNDENEGGYAGSLIFTDARLLLFPVRSAKGIFGWITCPFVLKRFADELEGTEWEGVDEVKKVLEKLELEQKDEEACYFKNRDKCKNELVINQNKIVLGDFEFKAAGLENLWPEEFLKELGADFVKQLETHMLIVSDEIFRYFVEMNTQIDTRIRIGEKGVVETGGLFTEEFLPEESILYSTVSNWREQEKSQELFIEKVNQEKIFTFGGNITLGKGITEVKIIKKE